jgi:large repetitive protein
MKMSWTKLQKAAKNFFLFSIFTLTTFSAQALTVNVVDGAGVAISNYRWIVEEDATKLSLPGQLANGGNLSLGFHTSYMHVVANGNTATTTDAAKLAALPATKRYFISVLPGAGYQMGGAQVAAGQTAVTVVANADYRLCL